MDTKDGNFRPVDTGGVDPLAGAGSHPSFAEFDGEDFDSGIAGTPQGGHFWFDVVPEITLDESQIAAAEFTDAEKAIVSVAVRRFKRFGGRTTSAVGGKADSTGYVTFEDFDEGPPREAFLLCYGHALNLLGEKNKDEYGNLTASACRALAFFFCYEPKEMTFDDAGAAMSQDIRRDVVRLRFMYEFWLSWMVLPPMPFNVVPLPGLIEDVASTVAGMEGAGLVHVIWQQPGIPLRVAIQKARERLINVGYACTEDELLAALRALLAEYLVSQKYFDDPMIANLYVTGANPEQEIKDKSLDPDLFRRVQRSTIWWSRLFSHQ